MAKFNILIEKDDDGYFVSEVVELPGCHTQAKSMDELIKRTQEAISLYLKCSLEKKIKNGFIGLQQLEV
jgi:predicted RNase H-like HicB family nuclease